MLKRASWMLGAVLVAILAPMGTSAAQAARCLPNGVCYDIHTPLYWGGYQGCENQYNSYNLNNPDTRQVQLSGAPRVYGVYVATKYNVRISGGPQFSVDRDPSLEACFFSHKNSTAVVQGCRYRIQWGRSYCTGWSQFRTDY